MSHVASIQLAVRSLTALRKAVEMHGCRLETATTYRWFGQSVGGHPLPVGFREEDLGQCVAKISVPGADYEIGVAPARNASGQIIPGSYVLLYDHWGPGQVIARKFGGLDLPLLKQAYAIEAVKEAAHKRGYVLSKTVKPDGRVVITLSR